MYGGYPEWVARVTALRDQLRGATGVARLDVGTSLLNAIGQAATAAPDPALRDRWLASYRGLRGEVAALRSQYTERPPAAWLRALDVFSDKALTLADDVAQGVGATAKALPFIVPVVALGLGALYLLPLLRRRGGKRGA